MPKSSARRGDAVDVSIQRVFMNFTASKVFWFCFVFPGEHSSTVEYFCKEKLKSTEGLTPCAGGGRCK